MTQQIFSGKNLEFVTHSCKQLVYMEITSTGPLGDSLLAALPRAQNLQTLIIKRAEVPISSVTQALSCCPHLQMAEFDCVNVGSRYIRVTWPQLDSLASLRIGLRGQIGGLALDMVCSFHCREFTHFLSCLSLVADLMEFPHAFFKGVSRVDESYMLPAYLQYSGRLC
jgi:hypothetical protein